MFLKALVRNQGIPFPLVFNPLDIKSNEVDDSVKLSMQEINPLYYYRDPDPTEEIMQEMEEKGLEQKDVVILQPLGIMNDIPATMYAQLLSKVPSGKITRWEDMENFLRKAYHLGSESIIGNYSGIMPFEYENGGFLPFWRIVSERGVLFNSSRCTKEEQLSKLKSEGIPVVPRGTQGNSYKVSSYKEFLFDFDKLCIFPLK